MAIDPLSAFILGTCCCICWPCLLPFCLSLPIIPLPMIIIRHQQRYNQNSQYRPHHGEADGTRNNVQCFPFECFNGQRYDVIWTDNGLLFKKVTKPLNNVI